MRRAVIVDVVRSPFGRGRAGRRARRRAPGRSLRRRSCKRSCAGPASIPQLIEDVITGCVIQVAEQSGNIGRQAVLAAGLPESVARRDARSQMRLRAAGAGLRRARRHRRRL